MPSIDTNILAELVQRRLTCLEQLRDMGYRQLELIEGTRMTALLDLLAIKQRALLELGNLERKLDPFRGQKPEHRHWPTEEARLACGAKIEQCDRLLREIVAQEKQCETLMRLRRDQAASDLQGVHHAGMTRGAYVSAPVQQVHQLDLSSERY